MKIYSYDFNDILPNVIMQFNQTRDIEEADAVLLWQDVVEVGKSDALKAKEMGKPVIVVEHGYGAHRDYLPPRSYPLLADTFCVWGKVGFKNLVTAGIDKNRIRIVGCPLLSRLNPREKREGITVAFAPHHWAGDLEENLAVATRLRDLKNIRVITKITDEHCPEWYENPILSLRTAKDHLQACANVLSQSDLVVALGIGTFELMAMYLNIPVIVVDIWRPKEFQGRIISLYQSDASDKVGLGELPSKIYEVLKNPNALRKKRLQFIKDNALAQGDASFNIANVVRESLGKTRLHQFNLGTHILRSLKGLYYGTRVETFQS